MHFRSVKDNIALPIHHLSCLLAGMPSGFSHAFMTSMMAPAKAAYFIPGGYLSRTVENFCRVTGRSDPWLVYSGMVDNIVSTTLHFARLYRHGRSELLSQTTIDPALEAELRQNTGNKGTIVVVPHCIGAVLSSAKLNTVRPTVLLVREPADAGRRALMLEYLHKLGPEFILARHQPPATVMRQIVRALHEGKIVVGTTDLVNAGADAIETHIFGQPICSPGWPARVSARLKVPILPGYIHMAGNQITLVGDAGRVELDLDCATQYWAASFEKYFRKYPSDWVFMLDKNWSRVLARAATKSATTPPFPTNTFTHSHA